MNILDLKRKLLPMSGFLSGGGSSGSTTSTSTTGLPDWAKGYAQDILAKQSALSDRPYEAYGKERFAGLDPLQVQAQQQAAGMTASPEIGQAAGIMGQVAQGGLDTQTFGQQQAQQYMDPYMQNVVDIQKRKAGEFAGIQAAEQQAKAVQGGAFGGSRATLVGMKQAQNTGQLMNDIQAQGSQAAYQQAQQQFNADQARRLSGLGVAAGAAGNLAGLGGKRFQQEMDINKLQGAYGAQRQGVRQQGLTQAYQDWQNQRDYPQQQLATMAGIMRGTPIGSTTTSTGTSTPSSPSFGQQLGSLVTGGWGLSQFFADGGSVDSQQNIESIVSKLLDPALDQAEEAAKARGDQVQLEAIQTEKAARASMRQGLASLPVNMNKMLPTEESMARGGIVAFAYGGKSGDPEEDVGPSYDEDGAGSDAPAQGPGNQDVYNEAIQNQLAQAKAISGAKYEPMKPEEYNRVIEERRASLLKGAGPSPYEDMRADVKRMGEESAQNLKYGRGLAALRASRAMLQGTSLIGGLAEGAGAFGEAYGDAIKADQAQKRAMQNMQINIADAERKEKMGFTKDAIAAADQARKDHQAAQMFGVDKAKALGKVYQGIAAGARPGAAAKPPAPPKVAEQAVQSAVATRMAREKPKQGETPEMMKDRITSEESNRVLGMLQQKFSVSDVGATRAGLMGGTLDLQTAKAVTEAVEKAKKNVAFTGEYINAKPEARKQMLADAEARARAEFPKAPVAPTAAPAAKPMPAAEFNAKWATLKSGQKLVGPDGIEYTKK